MQQENNSADGSQLRRSRRKSRVDRQESLSMQTHTVVEPITPIQQISTIYEQTQHLISNLDTQILKCKRFNEAKTYRKYEVMIKDLELQNQQLQQKLRREQLIRSPTKQYMNELLAKLVELKSTVDHQAEQLQSYRQQIKRKDQEIQRMKHSIIRQQNMLKMKIQRLPTVNQDKTVTELYNFKQLIKKYVQRATSNTSLYCLPPSKYSCFLKENTDKFKNLASLLRETDKWIDRMADINKGYNDQNSDVWRLKYTISKTITEQNRSRSPKSKKRMSLANVQDRLPNRQFKTEVDLGIGESRRLSRI